MEEKRPKYEPIDPKAEREVYALVEEVRREHHTSTEEASIALLWINDVKADADGHLMLGKCWKIGPREAALHEHDFAIGFNREVWNQVDAQMREAIVDHELAHVGIKVREETGESSWYVVKHDLEEFTSVVKRRGLYREGVRAFVDAAQGRDQKDLFDPAKEEHAPPRKTAKATP